MEVTKDPLFVVAMGLALCLAACSESNVVNTATAGAQGTATAEAEQYHTFLTQAANIETLGELPTPTNPKHDCFIDAYLKLGDEVLPQPLPSKEGRLREKVYDIELSTGRIIPMRVFGLGEISLAPGEHFAQTIEAMKITEKLTFTDVKYGQLNEINLWVFNKSTHITAEEAVELYHAFPVTYPFEIDGRKTEESMLAKMYFGWLPEQEILQMFKNGVTTQEVLDVYAEFRDVQYRHDEEINDSLQYYLEKGRDTARETGGICGEYAADLWQMKIDQLTALYEQGEIQIPFQGSQQRFTRPEWKNGEWGLILYVYIDPEVPFTAADPLSMVPGDEEMGDRISYFIKQEDGTEVPSRYPFTRLGVGPLAYHELSHAGVGASEDRADKSAVQLLKLALIRWMQGDFRADFVIIDNKTGLPIPPPDPQD